MALRWSPEQYKAHQDRMNRQRRQGLDKVAAQQDLSVTIGSRALAEEFAKPLTTVMQRALEQYTPKRSKYGNRAVVIDGIRFDSQAEGTYFQELQLRKAAGELRPPYFLLQVPFRLPGGITYRVDFVEFPLSGPAVFVDVKGVLTQTTLNKLKQVRALYDTTVRCVRKKGGGFVEYDWQAKSR